MHPVVRPVDKISYKDTWAYYAQSCHLTTGHCDMRGITKDGLAACVDSISGLSIHIYIGSQKTNFRSRNADFGLSIYFNVVEIRSRKFSSGVFRITGARIIESRLYV